MNFSLQMLDTVAKTTVIGSADGPTAIFVAYSISPLMLAGALLTAALIGYLLGSIEFGIVISKLVYHDDVRNHGSGNAGMTNILRTFGKKAAAVVLAGDMGKGVLSVLLVRWLSVQLFGSAYPSGIDIGAVAAFAAVVGHLRPLYFQFKGGKGVAVAAGTILATNPAVFLALLVVFLAEVAITKIVSLTSITCAVCYPVFTMVYFLLVPGRNVLLNTLFAACMGALVVYMHRENIRRLKNGTEYKFGQKKQ